MRVLITRAREDAVGLAKLLRDRNIDSLIEPLLDITYLEGDVLDLQGVQALLATSANGVRAFANRNAERDIPLFAVGDATMRQAREAGFGDVESASGDVDALAGLVVRRLTPADGALLHIAGSKVAGDLAGRLESAGFDYRREVLYTAVKADELGEETVIALKASEIDGVLLYSPRTAAAFRELAAKAGVEAGLTNVTAYCLSDAVAEKISALPWRSIRVATYPTQDSLLERLGNCAKPEQTRV